MSFDLSWLWSTLESIYSTLNSWFAGIWTEVSNIVNTGQGIFSGLVAFGSQLWDALVKFASTIGEWLATAFNWIYQGLIGLGTTFGQWLNSAFNFIAQGVTWIGSQVYNIGNWLYNGLVFIWNWMVNAITGAWNAIVQWFSGVATAIGSWWTGIINGVNTWWGNIVLGFRNKIIQTITADLTITGAWKGAERLLNAQKASDFIYGFGGIFLSPIIGRIVGILVDAVVPIPASTTYPLIPDLSGFSYTPPSMTIETPTPPTPPSPTVSGAPTGAFTGISEGEGTLETTYEASWMAGKDTDASINTMYETEIT